MPHLRQENIVEKPSRRCRLGPGEIAESLKRGHLEVLLQAPFARRTVEARCRQRRERGALFLQHPDDPGLFAQRLGKDDLARIEAGEFAGEVAWRDRRHFQIAGGDVHPGKPQRIVAAHPCQRHEIIVAVGIEQAVLGEGSRRHDAGDRPPHHRLGAALFRLVGGFGLLAHGDPVSGADEALQIVAGRMHRHPAHGDVLAQMAPALGERDAERLGGDLGVVEEQLVEIAHAIEQEAAGVRPLDLEILRHHRRGALAAAPVGHGVAVCPCAGRLNAPEPSKAGSPCRARRLFHPHQGAAPAQ